MKKNLSILLFLSLFNSYASADDALILQGKNFVKSLYDKHPKATAHVDPEWLNIIIATMHYLYSFVPAKNGGHDFSSGTIVLEDTNWELCNFLTDYAQKVFHETTCKEIWITLKKAYPRHSTHFNNYYVYTQKAKKKGLIVKKVSCDYVHYGIDIRKDQTLPVPDKHHILFGKIGSINGKPLMFIKFEEVGLCGKDAFLHMLNLIKQWIETQIAQIIQKIKGKHTVAMPTDTELQRNLDETVDNLSADDSLTTYRRENVPLDIMGDYIALLLSEESGLTKDGIATLKIKAKALGIQEIVASAEHHSFSDQGTLLWRQSMKNFAEEVKAQYPNDWKLRFGNEIIIFHEEVVDEKVQATTKPTPAVA